MRVLKDRWNNSKARSQCCLTLSFRSWWTQSSSLWDLRAGSKRIRIQSSPRLTSISWLKCSWESRRHGYQTISELIGLACKSNWTAPWTGKTKKSWTFTYSKRSFASVSKPTRWVPFTMSMSSWSSLSAANRRKIDTFLCCSWKVYLLADKP